MLHNDVDFLGMSSFVFSVKITSLKCSLKLCRVTFARRGLYIACSPFMSQRVDLLEFMSLVVQLLIWDG